MAHEGVGAGRYHMLARLDADRRGGEAVDADDSVEKVKSERHEHISRDRDPPRHVRPAEAMVERRDEDEQEESREGEPHDDALRRLLFVPGAGLHAPPQQFRIVHGEVDGKCRRGGNEDSGVDPALPVPQRPGRYENQRGQRQRAHDG